MIRLALFFLVLFLVAVSDIRKRIIPDWMPFLIAGVSLIPSEPVYLTGLFVALPLLIAGITVGGIGGGDIKLMSVSGLLIGGASMICAMCIGIITGGAYVTLMLVRKRLNKTDQFAFGPFLAFGLATAIFLGDKMAVWYLQFGAV